MVSAVKSQNAQSCFGLSSYIKSTFPCAGMTSTGIGDQPGEIYSNSIHSTGLI